jgi:ectoine hydroxylase-related dioxygenase (phytanoyl-CoA dioxygenase family)
MDDTKATASTTTKMDPALDRALREVESQGYTVLEAVIEEETLDAIHDAILRVERDRKVKPADNDFEGRATVRLYNLLAEGDPFAQIPIHSAVLPVVEGVLNPECLVSSLSSISIGPGESAQPIHCDDQVIGLPRPHPTLVCNSMWALTDFTEENGATRIVPGSHVWPEVPGFQADGRSEELGSIPAEMKRGSVLVWSGSLWHGGGANRTDARRVGIAMNYCAGFIRQQENQQLGIPRAVAAKFPERLQRLIGYGVYRHLIGHIDKRDPRELLGAEGGMRSIWDL